MDCRFKNYIKCLVKILTADKNNLTVSSIYLAEDSIAYLYDELWETNPIRYFFFIFNVHCGVKCVLKG